MDTPGGRFYAEWDDQAPVTREDQLMFFLQFLHVGGRWEEFLRECPLRYTGNRGHEKQPKRSQTFSKLEPDPLSPLRE